MEHCIILDIDGTLMDSAAVDNRCYWQAVRDILGLPLAEPELTGFTHVTDSGILQEWHQRTLGKAPDNHHVAAIKARFLELLEAAASSQPDSFTARRGLDTWLSRLIERGHSLAIATGGWRHSARFKLKLAELHRYDLPLSSSDDAVSRQDIMQHALERVSNDAVSINVTYVGDGPWDLECSREMGWNFIGVASGAAATRLLKAGAQRVHEDFISVPVP